MTISVGIAEVPKDGNNYEAVWQKADKALYQAKKKMGKRRLQDWNNKRAAKTDDVCQENTAKYSNYSKKPLCDSGFLL